MLVTLGALALGACGKKSGNEPAKGSGGSVAPGSQSTNGSDLPLTGDNPTTPLVAKAFGGAKPAFPQLSKDGAAAIVELETPVGLSGVTTYSVAFYVTANSVPRIVTLVDSKLVHLLIQSMETSAAPTLDTDTMAKTATAITKRLADEGFSAFEGAVDVPMSDTVTAGPLKLQIAENDGATITITATDSKGAQVASETIKPISMGKVGDIDCASVPTTRKAWFDTARKRVLLQIHWNAGPDQCDSPDDQYRLFAAP